MGVKPGDETFSTPNLKELERRRLRLMLPLSGAISTPSLMWFRWTVTEKQSLNVCAHNSTFMRDDLYHTNVHVYIHIHNSSLEEYMQLKFAPFCSSFDAFQDGIRS